MKLGFVVDEIDVESDGCNLQQVMNIDSGVIGSVKFDD